MAWATQVQIHDLFMKQKRSICSVLACLVHVHFTLMYNCCVIQCIMHNPLESITYALLQFSRIACVERERDWSRVLLKNPMLIVNTNGLPMGQIIQFGRTLLMQIARSTSTNQPINQRLKQDVPLRFTARLLVYFMQTFQT